MAQNLAQAKIKRSLHHNTTHASNQTYQTGDKVLVWREKIVENRIGEWIGPYFVISINHESKIVLVQKDTDSPHERHSITHIRRFLVPEAIVTSFMHSLNQTLASYSSKQPFPSEHHYALKRIPHNALKRSANERQDFSSLSNGPFSIQAKKLIEPDDPRANSPEMQYSVMHEVRISFDVERSE